MARHYEDMTDDELLELIDKMTKQRVLTGGHGKRAWMTLEINKMFALLDKRAEEGKREWMTLEINKMSAPLDKRAEEGRDQ